MKEENMQERGKDERGKHAGKRKDENMSKTRGKSVGEGLFSPDTVNGKCLFSAEDLDL